MTEIDVPDWVVAVALDAYNASRGTYEEEVSADADDICAAITAALGACLVPTACAEQRRIDYLSSCPRNTVEVSSMDTLSAGDIVLYALRQEKPE